MNTTAVLVATKGSAPPACEKPMETINALRDAVRCLYINNGVWPEQTRRLLEACVIVFPPIHEDIDNVFHSKLLATGEMQRGVLFGFHHDVKLKWVDAKGVIRTADDYSTIKALCKAALDYTQLLRRQLDTFGKEEDFLRPAEERLEHLRAATAELCDEDATNVSIGGEINRIQAQLKRLDAAKAALCDEDESYTTLGETIDRIQARLERLHAAKAYLWCENDSYTPLVPQINRAQAHIDDLREEIRMERSEQIMEHERLQSQLVKNPDVRETARVGTRIKTHNTTVVRYFGALWKEVERKAPPESLDVITRACFEAIHVAHVVMCDAAKAMVWHARATQNTHTLVDAMDPSRTRSESSLVAYDTPLPPPEEDTEESLWDNSDVTMECSAVAYVPEVSDAVRLPPLALDYTPNPYDRAFRHGVETNALARALDQTVSASKLKKLLDNILDTTPGVRGRRERARNGTRKCIEDDKQFRRSLFTNVGIYPTKNAKDWLVPGWFIVPQFSQNAIDQNLVYLAAPTGQWPVGASPGM